jgi:chemotaxis protein CheX
LRDSVPLISEPRNLDASIEEVFQTMLGVSCERRPETEAIACVPASELVTAIVGFGGVLSGACIIKCGVATAVKMA